MIRVAITTSGRLLPFRSGLLPSEIILSLNNQILTINMQLILWPNGDWNTFTDVVFLCTKKIEETFADLITNLSTVADGTGMGVDG